MLFLATHLMSRSTLGLAFDSPARHRVVGLVEDEW
jgi:hypothetical protein